MKAMPCAGAAMPLSCFDGKALSRTVIEAHHGGCTVITVTQQYGMLAPSCCLRQVSSGKEHPVSQNARMQLSRHTPHSHSVFMRPRRSSQQGCMKVSNHKLGDIWACRLTVHVRHSNANVPKALQ